MSTQTSAVADFESLLAFLQASRGFDFTSYKRSTLQRRVQKRMQAVGAETFQAYVEYLELHADEFQNLFNTILINVTSFFRDADAWEYLASEIVPGILRQKASDEPIRVWVAGCASGEEAYSIAIVFAEALGIPAFRERVKIYATDLDEEALASSRTATYSNRDIEEIPPQYVEKYFEKVNDRLIFDREIRRAIIFGRHDLLTDAPISRVDLLQCRNTLMYFTAEAQERILARFHFALREGGHLFLGKAETLLTHSNMFVPIDLKNRVFRRVSTLRLRDRLQMLSPKLEPTRFEAPAGNRLRDAALEAGHTAQIVIDTAGRLAIANERARTLFGIHPTDLGRSFHDLDLSFRPVELRSGIEQVLAQRRKVVHKDIHWNLPGTEVATLEVTINPLEGDDGALVGATVFFQDVTQAKRLQDELVNFNQELETAYEEVQSTNEELQTTNEELQSTVEELETTNEELQSSNEELETMNEELQSANEELEAMNEELRLRTDELNRVNFFLESILASLHDGVIVLNADLEVLAWNQHSEDLWGLRPDETLGRHLLNLDFGLPTEQLRMPIRACLSDKEPQTVSVEATNRRGKTMQCAVTITPLVRPGGAQVGVILLSDCKA